MKKGIHLHTIDPASSHRARTMCSAYGSVCRGVRLRRAVKRRLGSRDTGFICRNGGRLRANGRGISASARMTNSPFRFPTSLTMAHGLRQVDNSWRCSSYVSRRAKRINPRLRTCSRVRTDRSIAPIDRCLEILPAARSERSRQFMPGKINRRSRRSARLNIATFLQWGLISATFAQLGLDRPVNGRRKPPQVTISS